MMAFGWSAGDITISIRIIYKVVEAFDSAKGAEKKYAASRSFLRALVPILRRIKQYVENPEEDQFKEDMIAQGKIISDAIASFESYLDKRVGLSSRESKLQNIKDKLLWSLDDIQEKVQQLKTRVVDAVAFLGPLLAFEIRYHTTKAFTNVANTFKDEG